ncbi:MAG: signal peptidase II [Clostridiales bacterium]|jgi:signal peptidase II|nr:signal peptidase II [Clostridiales bacterium]
MKQKLRHLIYFILLVVLDQITKYWARIKLQGDGPISIIPGVLKLQYHENTGAVWGIMTGKVEFLSVMSIILSVVLVFIYFKIPQKRRYLPIQILWIFIIAGAIGNSIDRFYLKYVVDFIYFELINFPIFNIADSYLTVSCILLLILGIFYYKEEDFDFVDGLFKKKRQNNREKNDSEQASESKENN